MANYVPSTMYLAISNPFGTLAHVTSTLYSTIVRSTSDTPQLQTHHELCCHRHHLEPNELDNGGGNGNQREVVEVHCEN